MARVLLLLDNVSPDYVARVSDSAADVIRAAGHELITSNSAKALQNLGELMDKHTPIGVILTPPVSDNRTVLKQLEERHIPFVRIASLLDLERGTSVNMDELSAAIAITRELLKAGHRRIGFIRGPKEHLVSIRRYNGYVGALGGVRVPLDPNLVVLGDFTRQSGREAAKQLFRQKPTAIFASNDDMALGVIEAAQSQGIAIPDDLSLVGFDDNREARMAQPALTTVRQPLDRMGRRAAELVLEHSLQSYAPNIIEEVSFDIVARDSVKALEE